MNILQYQYIIAIHDTGSLTKAAKTLAISQPALSSWLNKLEDELGIALTIRDRNGLMLTPAGMQYYNGAKEILSIYKKTSIEIGKITTNNEKETIIIAGTPNGGARTFASIFSSFYSRFPNSRIQFVEYYNKSALQAVLDDKVDIAICSITQNNELPILEYAKKHTREIALMIPNSWNNTYDASKIRKDQALPIIDWKILDNMPFLMPKEEMSYYDEFMTILNNAGINLNIVFESSNVGILYQMAKEANGATIVPRNMFLPTDPISPYSLSPQLFTTGCTIRKRKEKHSPAEDYVFEVL